nr:MAG TPA: hypothetical protein [Caudoviricetes sp.]
MVKCLDKKFDKPDARAGARSLQRPYLLSAQCAAPERVLFHKTNFPFQSKNARRRLFQPSPRACALLLP